MLYIIHIIIRYIIFVLTEKIPLKGHLVVYKKKKKGQIAINLCIFL